ncbi:MAG: aldehyde ferredoxin oxidoreductase family protein [Bacteroidales bacterium]|nr:aldehyde ferredoxin oxidoreductase family protein [Bacteroidales bacterium]MCF8404922.1 aldehyde ferredoxin oxidoreductase family protein [Bacteroidales bacterium]
MKRITGGYFGKLLRVNLTNHTYKSEDLPEQILIDYIGGRGLGSKILYDEVPPKSDALGPHNILLFLTGPLTGIPAPTTSRFSVVSKSPLTGTVGGSSSGGHFGINLKSTGYDVLLVEGISDNPCYLNITDQKVEIKDASHLWGKNTDETTELILIETSPTAGVASIGPAGENQSLIASIMNEKNHAAGRGGLGAVMGSKKLKAVVVNGAQKTPFENKEVVDDAIKQWRTFVGEAPLTKDVLKEYGTPALVKVINHYGAFPTNNFQEGVFNDADSISGETFKELYFVKRKPCSGCPIGCARVTATPEMDGKGPEFETIWAYGALCGVNDLEQIIHANYNSNKYGFDTISAGNAIACAMELYEKDFLPKETKFQIKNNLGRDLAFGDKEAIVLFTELIGKNEGFGKDLALGSKRLAEKYGHPELAMHVKGLELPAYDPRGFHGMAISLATNNRGGCHLRSYLVSTEALATPFAINRFEAKGKPGLTKLYQDLTSTVDSMVACVFTSFALNPDLYAQLLGSVTGIEQDGRALLKTGERIYNLERLFNLREGLSRDDDTLPQRLLNEPFKSGLSKGYKIQLEALLDEYYTLRGWSRDGIPSKAKLVELNLLAENSELSA